MSITQKTDIPEALTSSHLQYYADNVDHNIRTIVRHGIFHGMGIVESVTPGFKRNSTVPRVNVDIEELKKLAKIDIKFYGLGLNIQSPLKYKKLPPVQATSCSEDISLLSIATWPVNRLGWFALCQMVYKVPFPGKSSVVFLPMIDMDPSNMTCIYSTLSFVSKQARCHNSDPVLTFDQPLYWKGRNIIQDEPDDSALHSIVLRLGGFHTGMSFLGSIGNIMNNTGLSELLESVYAPAAVIHMLSGKAISRAIRGHFLVYTALALLMITEINEIDINILDKIHWVDKENTAHEVDDNESEHGVNIPDEVTELLHVIDKLLDGSISVTELGENNAVKTLKKRIQAFQEPFGQNRTAKLWIEYMNMIDLLRQFITAERSGHWLLHLKSLQQMLPYLAASGHNLYVKSAHVYLQDMLELEQTHPKLEARLQIWTSCCKTK